MRRSGKRDRGDSSPNAQNFWDYVRALLLGGDLGDEERVRNAPVDFRERVSDSILGRREWIYLSEEEKRSVHRGERAELAAPDDLSAFEVKRHRLSFYEGETLLEIYGVGELEGCGPCYFLEGSGPLAHLVDGSVYILPQEYDPSLTLKLTPENALDYLRFYWFFVHKQNGPVFILDDLRHPVLDLDRFDEFHALELEEKVLPPVVKGGAFFWDYTFDVYLMYGDTLYKTTFIIDNGIVDETPLYVVAEGLPVNRLKGDYLIART